jgi:hypothetical protein
MQSQLASSAKLDRRALSPLKHGLTGRIYLMSDAEREAYDRHCRGIHESLLPCGEMETQLVQSLADDRWRLARAANIESAIFADATAHSPASEASGDDPAVEAVLAQVRAWLAEARNLNLLTLYESRIQRRFEKNLAELRRMQFERKAALAEAVREAALLSQLAESEGKSYEQAEAFTVRNFVFSSAEIAAMVSRYRRLQEAARMSAAPRKPLRVAA